MKTIFTKTGQKKLLRIAEVLMLVWFAVFTYLNADAQSLWSDELASIGFIKNGISLKDMFEIYLFFDTNLPLYSLILYGWYRIIPYGEQFLLLPSIFFCIGGIVLLSAAARRLKGDWAGFITLILGCSSNALIWQGAWEVRCYGLVFLLSAFTLWAYINKTLDFSKKNLIVYGGVSALFLWTHWFACILLAFYGLADLIMVVRKKTSWKTLLCYPVGLIMYLPWLIVSFISKQNELNHFWIGIPQWKDMPWTVLFFLGGRRLLWYLCLGTGALICLKMFYNLVFKKGKEDLISVLGCTAVLSIAWVIGIVYIYSRYINPEGSLFEDRYFTVIAPQIILITAWGIDDLIAAADKILLRMNGREALKKTVPVVVRGFVLAVLCGYWIICYKQAYISIHKPREEFRQVSDYLIGEGDVWNKNTALIASNGACVLDGFIDYYFEKRGYEKPGNIINGTVNSEYESRFYKNYIEWPEKDILHFEKVYCMNVHEGYDEDLRKFLEQYYTQIPVSYGPEGIEVWNRK